MQCPDDPCCHVDPAKTDRKKGHKTAKTGTKKRAQDHQNRLKKGHETTKTGRKKGHKQVGKKGTMFILFT